MNKQGEVSNRYRISPRFRVAIEQRIVDLERDAAHDERMLPELKAADHILRHRRLVAVQRALALSMRLFLDKAEARMPRPLIVL